MVYWRVWAQDMDTLRKHGKKIFGVTIFHSHPFCRYFNTSNSTYNEVQKLFLILNRYFYRGDSKLSILFAPMSRNSKYSLYAESLFD